MKEKREQTLQHTGSFQHLIRVKKKVIIPLSLIFVTYYFSLPLLIVCFPEMMKKPLWDGISLAWLLALSQFIMAGTVTMLYIWKAKKIDQLVSEVRNNHERMVE